MLTPAATAGESPFPFMGEAQERIHKWSLILLTKHSPHLPVIKLDKKKKKKLGREITANYIVIKKTLPI